jgi:hypothetical protein
MLIMSMGMLKSLPRAILASLLVLTATACSDLGNHTPAVANGNPQGFVNYGG